MEDMVEKSKEAVGVTKKTEGVLVKGGFDDREHNWLNNLPEASKSMHLAEKKLQKKESSLFKSEVKKHESRGRNSSYASYTDDYEDSDDEDSEHQLDGELLKPEWDGCKTFVKLYSPDKASCRRYEVGMSNAGLKADRKGKYGVTLWSRMTTASTAPKASSSRFCQLTNPTW